MASNGSVVAESKQEPDSKLQGGGGGGGERRVSPSRAAPKPEVARKPQPPGNKPCPPIPKKPPVAHKPQPPSLTPSSHHGSAAAAGAACPPASPSPSPSPAPCRAPPPPPSAPPSFRGQGPACGPPTAPPITASKPGVKAPPPPLPKTPPKGTPPSGRRGREPPPRPSPLAPGRKPPPPVPAKKPASRKPAAPQSADQDAASVEEGSASPCDPSQTPPDNQASAGESAAAGADVRLSASSLPPPSCHGEILLRPTDNYQQVVVEENFANCAKTNVGENPEKLDRLPQQNRPKSYENLELKRRSQDFACSEPLRSYEQVVVEENAHFASNVGVNAVCKPVESGPEPGESEAVIPPPSVQEIVSGAGDHVQSLLFSDLKDSTATPISQHPVDCDHSNNGDSNTKSNETKNSGSGGSVEALPSVCGKAPSPNRQSEGEGRSAGSCQAVVREQPKRPPRPAVPPPVRPKPRKRVSLLRQVQVTDEDSAQDPPADVIDPPTPTPSLPPSSADPQTPGSPVEESIYQEIDDLKPPSPSQTDSDTPGGCVDGNPSGEGVLQPDPPGSNVTVCSESCNEPRTEQTAATADNVESDDAQRACLDGSTSVGEEICDDKTAASVGTVNTGGEVSCPQTEVSDKPVAGDADSNKSSNSSRQSPEKQSVHLDDVGETSFMLKEIEQLLKVRLGSVQAEAEGRAAKASSVLTSSQSLDTPIRPPRPKRADKLRKLTIGSCSADSSSTESLTSVGLPGKKAPPKPKRKSLPAGAVNRSLSDVTGMKVYVERLNSKEEEEEEKPYLPPRQQSLRLGSGQIPPPLPPRNKSMEQAPEECVPQGPRPADPEGEQSLSTADRRASAPTVGLTPPTVAVRTSLGGKPGRKPMPRPTRKAPPPPPHPPSRPLSTASTSSDVSSKERPSSMGEKVPGYQKINGAAAVEGDINTVVPKSAVVGTINSPSPADVSADHDYHEIPDHLVADLSAQVVEVAEEPPADQGKEGTPPPVLPPRVSQPPLQPPTITTTPSDPSSDLSESSDTASLDKKSSSNDVSSKTETSPTDGDDSSPQDAESEGGSQLHNRLSGHTSADDSLSQCSQRSSRPESFCSEVLGSLAHVVGPHHIRARPASTHSSSSHSETGSGEVEVPTFDHSSASESENEDDEERVSQKREKKVYYIAEEVVKSEKVFVDVLKLLNVDFRVFMSGKTEQAGHTIVPAETLNKILDFLPQLQSFNEMLLKDLTDRIANWDKQKKIADIFVKKGPFLKLYSSYIRNFEHATALLDETCKKHNGFGMALQQFELSPRCASLALKHYMLKPIQRIPQYKLLLQDYLKHLTPESPDYKDTITALNIVSEVADHANESMRHGDNVQKLLEIQRSLIGQFEVIQPGRVLIRQGELMKMSRKEMQPRMFFLFSDVLLYTTPTATGYRLNNILPLQGMKVLPPKLEEFNNEFNIITTQRSFTVATSTPEEREEWLRALWNAIEENSERYHTFKAMQPEPKTSLLDKDFVLGTKAPLWVPDARVTMCMLCLAEFSITWRRHHCRACGRIICGNCSENKAPLRYLMYKPARVCDECFEKLAKEVEEGLEKEQKPQGDKPTSPAPTTPTEKASSSTTPTLTSASSPEPSGLSFSSIKARFQKIRKSARERRKPGQARPSVLKEVHANDEGSAMSGYLWVAKNKKWKRLWFVVKGKVLYTYKASEDMAAIESMPLLGFEVTRMTSWYQGAEPDLMFELHHQNTQPLIFKPRNPSSSSGSSGGDRNSVVPSEDGQSLSPASLSPHVKSSADTTTPRLIFRTDSAAATTKWLNVLREASLA
ncbi:uncharacterized protein LOC143284890 [Babylonia areolata]|uniref:uncharacterized protein LOC143284890 n=1 Tax=Babylonia areolata TaxID=304850 RepID=UPI003FD226BB